LDFRIRQLRCFLTLSVLLNYGKTARALYMSQTTATFQIKSLEDSIGVKLFERNHRRVCLTSAGAAFVPYAQRIVDSVDAATLRLQEIQNPLSIRIACGRAGHVAMLAAVFRALHQSNPDFHLQVAELTTEQQIAGLAARELDAVLMVPHLPIAGLRFDHLSSERLYILVATHHSLASHVSVPVEALRGVPILTTRLEDCRLHQSFLHALLAPFHIKPRLIEFPQSSKVQFAFVAAGQGIAIVPASMASHATPGIKALPIAEALPPVELGLATMPENSSDSLRLFREIVLDCAAALAAESAVHLSAA
jgi:DNA-binding transcriptional LysR family regulator